MKQYGNRGRFIIVAGFVILAACDGEPQPTAQKDQCYDEQWKDVPCHSPNASHIHHGGVPMIYGGGSSAHSEDEGHANNKGTVTRGGFGSTGRGMTSSSAGA